MKYIYLIISVLFCAGCTSNIKIKINDSAVQFSSFPSTDSLKFVAISDQVLEEPSKILLQGDKMIIETFCRAKDKHVIIYSLSENRIINEIIKYGEGPGEMLSCDIGMINDKLWLYDLSKMQIGFASMDSFLLGAANIIQNNLDGHYYYNTAMLNDSIMLGTNDMTNNLKITYVNLNTGSVSGRGSYAYLDDNIALEALIDASSCYIDVNPTTKDILLSYRYTDMIEIYNSEGEIKHALQGPMCFDVEFQVTNNNNASMAKTKETRKAYVNSYVTGNYIYLLFSGCKRDEKNWANGNEIHVFSWDGKPQKRYVLEQPIYTFAVDEDKHVIYSYSLQSEELIQANI